MSPQHLLGIANERDIKNNYIFQILSMKLNTTKIIGHNTKEDNGMQTLGVKRHWTPEEKIQTPAASSAFSNTQLSPVLNSS
jgi:hypothetical protein